MGPSYEAGDVVLACKYYQKWGHSKKHYVLLEQLHNAFIYSNLV